MKINSIQQICKGAKRIELYTVEDKNVQWISDGGAFYPLYNLPQLEQENVFTMFDIPEDKQNKIRFEHKFTLPQAMCFEDRANGETLLDLTKFTSLKAAVDVIYNPLKTKFISDAEKLGVATVSGLSMLVAQAVMAHEYFFDMKFDNRTAFIEDILAKCTSKVCNIVLVGMPGSGKTTVGKKLAQKTGMTFYDSDIYLEEKVGRKIPDIIENDGEAAFRDMETECLAELTKISGCIIATGGGAVLREHNRYLIRQNGICFYIKRDIEKLSTKGRPLSQGGNERLYQLYEVRNPIYEEVSDYAVETHENTENCTDEIYDIIYGGLQK